MDRRRTPNVGKRHKSPKSRSAPTADHSLRDRRPDEAYGISGGVNSMATSGRGLQKKFDSRPAAEDFRHDCQVSNAKKLSFDLKDLKLMNDTPLELDGSQLLKPFSSNINKDFPSPSSALDAKDKKSNGHGSQRYESSQRTDFSFNDRLKGKIQRGENSPEYTRFNEQSDNSNNRYDICPPKTGSAVRLKAPLHVKNREIRNENKRKMDEHNILILRPGMILLKSYISFKDQVMLVRTCRELGLGSGGFYQPGYGDGATLNLKMMCLGKNWDPVASAYGDERPCDGARAPPIPDVFSELVKRAIADSHDHLKQQSRKRNVEHILPSMSPNICIVNFYTKSGKLGLHQDKDETIESLRKGLPVVSFSVGDSADFAYCDQRDILNVEKIKLESGDVLIFGGQARHIYHGVTAIYSDTAPQALIEEANLRPGRLNLTFREY